jgi:DNA-binding transcriptional ArsR family regulator
VTDESDLREELRDEIRSLKSEIRHQVELALKSSSGSVTIDLGRDDLDRTEPSNVVVSDLVKMIREDVKSSLATRGENAVDELVERMSEEKGSDLLKALANEERIKIVKMLYSSPRTFSDLKGGTSLESASVSHHMKSLLNMGLVSHSDEGGYELTRRGRILVRTLALMNEAIGGERVD